MRNFIGTSGFSYNHWQGVFYPDGLSKSKWLEFYSENFDTVELNSTFYHLPKENTIKGWLRRTPENFIFSVKASKFITHVKKLKDAKESLNLFLQRAALFKNKLGAILLQLPPSLKKDTILLKDFLSILDKKYKYTIEFRNETWLSEDIFRILEEFNVAFCISDTPKYPYAEIVTADFTYIRLHGHTALYASEYTEKELKHYANLIKKWNLNGIYAFVYFDNDFEGYAVKNAKRLKELLKET